MAKMTKIMLQKLIMLEGSSWWNINDLTEVVRYRCKAHGLSSINHATVERNIRHFREPKHGLRVQKRKISDNTFEYRVTRDFESTKNPYAMRK